MVSEMLNHKTLWQIQIWKYLHDLNISCLFNVSSVILASAGNAHLSILRIFFPIKYVGEEAILLKWSISCQKIIWIFSL